MNKLRIKGTLTLCSTLALLTLASTNALADPVPTGEAPAQEAVLMGDQQAATVDRQITVINPVSGEKAVVTQTATKTPGPDGADTNIWQVYFPPVYQGYKPSQPFVPVTVVTPETQPSNVEITYRPLKQDDIRTNTFAGIFFKDVNGKRVVPMLCQPVDKKGIVQMPEAPKGWEYINRDQLPDSFICYDYKDPFYVFLVKRPAEQVQTKQVTRKIICHLPGGDKVYTQTVTATKIGKQPWKLPAFPAFNVPTPTGYQPSLPTVQKLTADPDQAPVVVEVTYQAITPTKPVDPDQPTNDHQAVKPDQDSQPADTPANTVNVAGEGTTAFPDLKDRLAQLQAPLDQLENNEQTSRPVALPQTGNHSEKSGILPGLISAAWAALSVGAAFKKKRNYFK